MTHRLKKDVGKWHKRKHGEVDFHLSQALSGHGCFGAYLHKIGKAPTTACWYCDFPHNDAEHTIFVCDAWHGARKSLSHAIRADVDPDTIIDKMLESNKDTWRAMRDFVHHVMSKKETEERRRQGVQINYPKLIKLNTVG